MVQKTLTSSHAKKTEWRQWALIFCVDVHMAVRPTPIPQSAGVHQSLTPFPIRVGVINRWPLYMVYSCLCRHASIGGDLPSWWDTTKQKRWAVQHVITRAHSFPGQNLANHGTADEIPRLTEDTQLNFRGLIKSWINRSNTCYELMNPSLFIH